LKTGNKMKSLLVMGASGMLGSMVYHYLSQPNQLEVAGSVRFHSEDFIFFDASERVSEQLHSLRDFNYIINCIGVIKPYCKDDDAVGINRAIKVNALFPFELGDWADRNNVNIIQIATDCVYSGTQSKYTEDSPHDALDAYGKTKSLGEYKGGHFLNIRCSIIGPEKKNKVSLLEWFLNQPPKSQLNGFSHYLWNGVTTLQFAELCEQIILQDRFDDLITISPVHHFVPNNMVSKYELLTIFREVFKKDFSIRKVDNVGPPVDRTLASKFSSLSEIFGYDISMIDAVTRLKQYIDEYQDWSG